MRKNAGFSVDQQMGGESFRITLLRFEKQKEKFDSLRRLQLLCKFHFGPRAAKVFDDLHAVVHEIIAAAHVGAITPDEPFA